MASLYVLTLLLVSPAKAGFSARCIQSWTKSEKKIEGTYSDLSLCQQSTLGLKSVNDILLGGKGSAKIIGIDAGSGGDGCSGGDSCMKQCQALCCITSGCIYSSIKKDTHTTDYVVYKEEETKFYCSMYSSGTLKNSDTQSTCYPPSGTGQQNTPNCEAIALEGMGWDVKTYQGLASLSGNSDPNCASKRRLLSVRTEFKSSPSSSIKIPSRSAIRKSTAKAFKPFKALKKALKKKTTGTQKCDGLKAISKKATSIYDRACFSI